MSRIGKQPVKVPANTEVKISNNVVFVKGPKGELKIAVHPKIKVENQDNVLMVTRSSEEKFDKSLHGLTRALINNMIVGVNQGFAKDMEINGVGYKIQISGSKLTFNLGFSHPIHVEVPKGLTVTQDKEKKNLFKIEGIDKQLVGEFAAKIRGLKEPEPYKGKGIKYLKETLRRKAGKAAAKGE